MNLSHFATPFLLPRAVSCQNALRGKHPYTATLLFSISLVVFVCKFIPFRIPRAETDPFHYAIAGSPIHVHFLRVPSPPNAGANFVCSFFIFQTACNVLSIAVEIMQKSRRPAMNTTDAAKRLSLGVDSKCYVCLFVLATIPEEFASHFSWDPAFRIIIDIPSVSPSSTLTKSLRRRNF